MIFLNRRRTIIENGGSEAVKDPSKYWYVEKYVYSELKETLEIPLKTSIKFEGVESGYSDDTFCGWSISNTSTTRTFTATTSYSNTTTSVKNRLDSDNTLKIYAVYRYPYTAKSLSYSSSLASGTNKLTFLSSGTMSVTSNYFNHRVFVLSNGSTVSDNTVIQHTPVKIYDSVGNLKDTITITGDIIISDNDTANFNIDTTNQTPTGSATSAPSGTFIQNSNIVLIIECTAYMQNWNKLVYRVESHTPTVV